MINMNLVKQKETMENMKKMEKQIEEINENDKGKQKIDDVKKVGMEGREEFILETCVQKKKKEVQELVMQFERRRYDINTRLLSINKSCPLVVSLPFLTVLPLVSSKYSKLKLVKGSFMLLREKITTCGLNSWRLNVILLFTSGAWNIGRSYE